MDLPDPKDFPYFKFCLAAAPAKSRSGPVRLTMKDINALPGISECIADLIKIIPDQVEAIAILVGSDVHVYLVPIQPGKQGAECAQKIGDQLADVLDDAADNLRENAQSLEPQPYASVVTSKPVQTVLKAFATANEESPLKVAFVRLDGSDRALPIPDTAELPVVLKRVSESMVINAKIIGLIRGEDAAPHHLILEGGVHIQLPKRTPWEWDDIHLVLEQPHVLSGTLIRLPNSNKWTVDTDAKVASQSEMDLAPVGV